MVQRCLNGHSKRRDVQVGKCVLLLMINLASRTKSVKTIILASLFFQNSFHFVFLEDGKQSMHEQGTLI